MKKMLKRYTVWTYVVFWSFLLLIGAVMLALKMPTFAEVLKVISSWTPTFILIAMFRRIYPDDNLKDFIKRQFSEQIKISTVLGVTLLQLVALLGSFLYLRTSQNVPMNALLTTTSGTALLLIFVNNLIRGSIGEELGWRGYMQIELQKKYSPLKSAIIVGVIWGFWHTPLWFISSGYAGMQLLQYVAFFLVAIISTSIIITAFYNLNRNLVIPIVAHQLFNFFLVIQKGDLLRNMTVTSVIYLALAVVLILVNYKKCLYGKPAEQLEVAV